MYTHIYIYVYLHILKRGRRREGVMGGVGEVAGTEATDGRRADTEDLIPNPLRTHVRET